MNAAAVEQVSNAIGHFPGFTSLANQPHDLLLGSGWAQPKTAKKVRGFAESRSFVHHLRQSPQTSQECVRDGQAEFAMRIRACRGILQLCLEYQYKPKFTQPREAQMLHFHEHRNPQTIESNVILTIL